MSSLYNSIEREWAHVPGNRKGRSNRNIHKDLALSNSLCEDNQIKNYLQSAKPQVLGQLHFTISPVHPVLRAGCISGGQKIPTSVGMTFCAGRVKCGAAHLKKPYIGVPRRFLFFFTRCVIPTKEGSTGQLHFF
jgi:hypothetical protein